MPKLTTIDFINKACKIQGSGKYDYSKVIYKNWNDKVCIICPIHGEFFQDPHSHLAKHGCPNCAQINGSKKRKLTQESFIEKANKIYGVGVYDYSKMHYVDLNKKICILCSKHGEFYQNPGKHLAGFQGCKICNIKNIADKKRLTTEKFIERSNNIHKLGTYDYTKVLYVRGIDKVCIICSKHGEFWQEPSSHLKGYGCSKCAIENLSISFSEFLYRANSIHGVGTYDYSMVKIEKNSQEKINIICKTHGEFFQKAIVHIAGQGCPRCGRMIVAKKLRLTKEDFIKKAKIVHGELYDYSKVDYINNTTKIFLICKIHGEFSLAPNSHLSGVGCPYCSHRKGEMSIRNWLEKHGIEFKLQYKYPDLKGLGNLPLRFDFYIPLINLLVEYDGEQHFFPVCFHGISPEKAIEGFRISHRNDKFKEHYCSKKRIPLLRIPYTNIKNVPEIMECFFMGRGSELKNFISWEEYGFNIENRILDFLGKGKVT